MSVALRLGGNFGKKWQSVHGCVMSSLFIGRSMQWTSTEQHHVDGC